MEQTAIHILTQDKGFTIRPQDAYDAGGLLLIGEQFWRNWPWSPDFQLLPGLIALR